MKNDTTDGMSKELNIDEYLEGKIERQSVRPIDFKKIIEDEIIGLDLKITNENYEEVIPIEEEVVISESKAEGNSEDNSNRKNRSKCKFRSYR